MEESRKRYAVVIGSNQGIGFGTVKQLASNGIMTVLTALDEKKGIEAVEALKDSGLSDLVVYHQLDVIDPASIASLADFVKTRFGKLDILVNNAGVSGTITDPDAFRNAVAAAGELKIFDTNDERILILPLMISWEGLLLPHFLGTTMHKCKKYHYVLSSTDARRREYLEENKQWLTGYDNESEKPA